MGILFKTVSRVKKLLENKLPKRALSNFDLQKYVKTFKIKHFRGVFMHDALPVKIRRAQECGIINLDESSGLGTHWVAYRKLNKFKVIYFDPVGNLRPPPRIVKYFNSSGKVDISYNYTIYQFKSYNCGHLCLRFLLEKL
jgi:hypothetical protein